MSYLQNCAKVVNVVKYVPKFIAHMTTLALVIMNTKQVATFITTVDSL